MAAIDLEALRKKVRAQRSAEREIGYREVAAAGKAAAPLIDDLMWGLKADYAYADQFGEDARPTEAAVYAILLLVPEAALTTDAHVGTLSHLARNRRSFPNAAEMAEGVLRKKGLTPVAPKKIAKLPAPGADRALFEKVAAVASRPTLEKRAKACLELVGKK